MGVPITCYKSHLVILKKRKPTSSDSELKKLIISHSQRVPLIDTITSNKDIIKAAMANTRLKVGKLLLSNEAILLPSIHDYFVGYARDTILAKGLQESQCMYSVSSRLILSDLISNYKHHIACSCKVRKYGTLVYRSNADLASLLSEALWKLRSTSHTTSEVTNEKRSDTDSSTGSFSHCFDHLSQLVHSQINAFLKRMLSHLLNMTRGKFFL